MNSGRVRSFAGLILAALIFCGVPVQAQDDSGKVQLPAGPLIQAAPNPGRWTVTYSYPEERTLAGGVPMPGAAAALKGRPHLMTFTNFRDVTHIEVERIQDTKQENWRVGATVYGKPAGTETYVQATKEDEATSLVDQAASGKDIAAVTASKEFPGLEWVAPESYLGTAKYSGHVCLVFAPSPPPGLKTSDSAFTPFAESAPEIAYIDAETRFPVEVRTNGVYRTYRFADPPGSLSLPDDLAGQLKKAKAALDLQHQMAPRPY